MKIKVTIQLDDEKFSASTTGPGDDEAAIGRAVAACFAAIGSTDGNLNLNFLLARTILAAWDGPEILRAAAQAWVHHDIEPKDIGRWRLLIDHAVWHPIPKHEATLHQPIPVDLERVDGLLLEMEEEQHQQKEGE